jgi:spore germination protein KA
MKQVVEGILNGDTALFIEGSSTALLIASRKIEQRGVEKPLNEGTVLASLDSYTENLDTNCGMIIKRLPTSSLRFETFNIGKLAPTKIKLAWLEGIANPTIVDEARRRINRINIDYISGIGTLAELIEDSPFSIFPKYRQTERPDVTAKALTDGHFAILCTNNPFALFAPIALWDNLKTMDDYAERTTSASYLRLARYAAFLMSILISPVYLSFVTYNQTIVPQSLAVAIAAGRAGVPFPSAVELLLMTLAITIIREAAMRIPGSVGYFVGTLAAVVIGQASVAAGYVSASMIIVVAASEISSFAISTTTIVYTSRLINYFFIVLASMFGMFGLINGIAIVFWHLASLESFGVPYLYPLVPFELEAMKDTFVRFGILRKRFKILAPFNRLRIGK